MKTTHLLTLLTTSALVIAGSVAQAQPGRGGPGGDRGGRAAQILMTLRAADANSDNAITRAEMESLQDEMFAWMDRTGDGYLDEADQSPVRQRLRAIQEARLAEEGGDRPRRRPRGGRGPEGELHRADTNDDRRISQDEFMVEAMRGFERLDTNDDDTITADELDQAVERRQSRGLWWRD